MHLRHQSKAGEVVTNTCAQCGRIYDPAKPHDCADRTAFTHGLELLDDPEVTYTCARCGQLYDPSLHHVCLDGSTARSILSSALTGTRPYDQAGRAIKKLADHGYSIVPTPCRHSIYHHGCPSCDRQDPEDRE